MLGNILAVGLMSMGMGLSGVKDEPNKKLADTQEAIYMNTITKANAIAFFSNYLNLTEEPENQTYTFEANTIQGYGMFAQTYKLCTNYRIRHNNPHTSSSNSIALEAQNPDDATAWADALRYNIDRDTLESVYNEETRLTVYTEEVGSLLTTGELPEEPMGEQIIPAIASGLGIIGALASNFLVGFGALFYAEGALTPFAIFALVMLGVAVSFAVVKLVLNLIRSNTGA